ncbi:hypothetical protein ACLOJK_026441 [Asimina triloba]
MEVKVQHHSTSLCHCRSHTFFSFLIVVAVVIPHHQTLDHLKAIFAMLSIISYQDLIAALFKNMPSRGTTSPNKTYVNYSMKCHKFPPFSILLSNFFCMIGPLSETPIIVVGVALDFFLMYVADRFILVRSTMNFDMAHYLLTESTKDKENEAVTVSPSKEAYKKHLAKTLLLNRTKILAFKRKPSAVVDEIFQEFYADSVLSHPDGIF